MIKTFKLFDSLNDLDPYNEEDWDNRRMTPEN